MAGPLLLLDTASLYYRAYFGLPDSMTAPDGMPVNAVRGLLDVIGRLTVSRKPRAIVACWDDDWRPTWRVDAIPTYKAHRVVEVVDGVGIEETPDTLSPQIPVILQVLESLGVPVVGASDNEADDVIGTLATREKGPVEIVTGDRDLFQLVTKNRSVIVLYTAGGVRELIEVDCDWIANKYGIPGDRYEDFALMRGDSSDGLPGVKGIGEKTAAALLNTFGSLENAYKVLDKEGVLAGMAPSVAKKLDAGREYVAAAEPVVRVARSLDLPPVGPPGPEDAADLESLSELYNLGTSLSRARDALARIRA